MKKLKFKKLSFINDLGDIKTIDNRKVKTNLLYRSSILSKIDLSVLRELKDKLNIKTIIDLRSEDELSEVSDIKSNDMKYLPIPILSSEDNPSINRNNRLAILKSLMKKEGGTIGHLSGIYRTMVSGEVAINGYKEIFNILSSTNDGLLWHCTQGKDRTGMVTSLILLALGVSVEDTKRQYLLFNKSCRFKNFWIFVGITIFKFNPHMASELINLLTARSEYFDAAIDEINLKYGNIDNYFNLIGLTSDKIENLKLKYLE